jgi:AmmeMemoRadiSam system protein A
MSSVDTIRTALAPHETTVHAIARTSIHQGFGHGAPPWISPRDYSSTLQETMASFVTLRQGDDLRGCVGTAYAVHPLAEDVSRNAFFAAFSDLRFSPLSVSEFDSISIEVSVLSPPQPLSFDDEEDLADRLVPGRDGLILEYKDAWGLFLPQVWETLSEPHDFLDCLKDKAGLPSKPLDPTVRALRFEAIKFQET